MLLELQKPIQELNLRLATLKIAQGELGVTEEGNNWGPRVSQYLAEANIRNPAAWCAAFVNWSAKQAANALRVISPLEGIQDNVEGYVEAYYQYARVKGWLVPSTDIKSGDLFFVWFPSLRRHAHIGFVYEVDHRHGTFTTIEGNSNSNHSREGKVVCQNTRQIIGCNFARWTKTVQNL